MIDPLNPEVRLTQLRAFTFKRTPPFTMPPPEGIVPGLCKSYERQIRNVYAWGKKKHYFCEGMPV